MNKVDLKRLAGYDEDLARWSAEQAKLLLDGRLDRADLENLSEEIASVGRSEEGQIDARMEVLIQHLLKWQYQPDHRTNSWKAGIVEQRIRIGRVLKRSPSLRRYASESVEGSFVIGRAEAIRETGLPETGFPETCPYSIEQILDPQFLPD
jgi:hypothetical protein